MTMAALWLHQPGEAVLRCGYQRVRVDYQRAGQALGRISGQPDYRAPTLQR